MIKEITVNMPLIRVIWGAFGFGISLCPGFAMAVVDLDGNQASEFWESRYPGILVDETDSDFDGCSNFDEMVAGTDPLDPQSLLQLAPPILDENEFKLQWDGIAGKVYTVQMWNDETLSWDSLVLLSPSVIDEGRSIMLPVNGTGGVYRLMVGDVDEDQDGLTAWEESLLGWDDGDMHGSGLLDIPDFEMALSLMEQPEGVTLANGESLPQRLPTKEEASRFLVQSTFGPTTESIEEVMQNGMTGWLKSQIALSATKTRQEMSKTGQPLSALLWRHGWWRSILVADDQLRHRMAYALSQILVVNNEPGSLIGDNPLTHASYYDPFIEEAFGSYRDILDHVTYSPSMGFYLSHMNNRKSNMATQRFPDENFAREVMQLFTIGLWELEMDGSRRQNIEGNDIPTYNNSVITELAKVFTGMSNGTTNRGLPATSFYDPATGDDYKWPMKVWDEEHEPGPKYLFRGVVIPDGQTGEEDVQLALDALVAHDNTAPFISRLLIQRLTSSNPSPEYLRRVSLAWEAGSGNLGKVVKAILLDPEARTRDEGTGIRGKLREPLIRMTHIMRAFAKSDESGPYGVFAPTLNTEFGQFVMSSPTVFNFYQSDYSPVGDLRSRGLVAPELQIATVSSLLATHDRLRFTSYEGHWMRAVDYSDEIGMLDDIHALIEHLDTILTYGTMSATTKAVVREQLLNQLTNHNKIFTAVHLIVTSPEFTVLK